MKTREEQEDFIRELGNKDKYKLQEIIRYLYSIDFPDEEIFDFVTIIGALGIKKLDLALKLYWQLDENSRLNFIELIN
jgi:hypothetical protein